MNVTLCLTVRDWAGSQLGPLCDAVLSQPSLSCPHNNDSSGVTILSGESNLKRRNWTSTLDLKYLTFTFQHYLLWKLFEHQQCWDFCKSTRRTFILRIQATITKKMMNDNDACQWNSKQNILILLKLFQLLLLLLKLRSILVFLMSFEG